MAEHNSEPTRRPSSRVHSGDIHPQSELAELWWASVAAFRVRAEEFCGAVRAMSNTEDLCRRKQCASTVWTAAENLALLMRMMSTLLRDAYSEDDIGAHCDDRVPAVGAMVTGVENRAIVGYVSAAYSEHARQSAAEAVTHVCEGIEYLLNACTPALGSLPVGWSAPQVLAEMDRELEHLIQHIELDIIDAQL